MGRGRERLKKSLGITEYPWSSDDELEEPNQNPPPEVNLPPRQSEARPSMGDLPGTSALPSSSQSPQSPVTARRIAKFDRDLFWSILNNTETPLSTSSPTPQATPTSASAPTNRSRINMETTMPHMTGALHTPTAEFRERISNRPRSAVDIQRLLAFKRLTRNLNALRNRSASGLYSMSSRGNTGATVWHRLNRNNSPAIRRLPTVLMPGYSRNVMSTTNAVPFVGMNAPARDDEPIALTTHRSRTRTRDSEQEITSPAAHMQYNINLHNSEDEAENVSSQSVSVQTTQEVNLTLDEPDAEMNNASEMGMSLEEEIVEIDAEEVPAGDATIELEDDAAPLDPEQSSAEPNLAPTSTDSVEPQQSQPHQQPQQSQPQPRTNHGVKRKRRDSHDNPEPYTVKEFNQNLLRLLECPVCLEWMEPPMCQCRRGHLVCGRCRARLADCPVCRTTFSSVRNRAMEAVAEMLRYPCRHGCGRDLRLRRRAPHEASCAARPYRCPAPACHHRQPLPRAPLRDHIQRAHLAMLKIGGRHKFSLKVNVEQHDTWLVFAMDEYFHLRIDIDVRVVVYVAYIGPKCDAKRYKYEVSLDGQHNSRMMLYVRATHSDLESLSLNVTRQDCFHLSLDQALNYIRVRNRHCDTDKHLELTVDIGRVEPAPLKDESDS